MQRDHSRQSFLDPALDRVLENVEIGVIGAGGGGSHIGQQVGHIGFKQPTIVDPQRIEDSNLTRLVTGRQIDVDNEAFKVHILERTIKDILPDSRVRAIPSDWKSCTDRLKLCDVILGGVDTFSEREQLESFCRRNRIVYIDVGMKVTEIEDDHQIYGQVIVSVPGRACMRCMNFINEQVLQEEADGYGDVGVEPQVVWSNGVLASTAVGLLISGITAWNKSGFRPIYLQYNGNTHELTASGIQRSIQSLQCKHFPDDAVGDIRWT